MRTILFGLAVIATALAAPAGFALDHPGYYASPAAEQGALNMNRQLWSSSSPAADAASSPKGKGGSAGAKAVSKSSDLHYVASAARSQQIQAAFLQKIAASSPQLGALVGQQVSQHTFVDRFNADLNPYGLHSDDLGDALAAYWIVMWSTANERNLPSRSQVSAVRIQVARQFSGNRSALPADDVSRQEIAEGMIYETEWMLSMRGSATTDEQRKQVADVAENRMLGSGFDLRSLRLADTGFSRAPQDPGHGG